MMADATAPIGVAQQTLESAACGPLCRAIYPYVMHQNNLSSEIEKMFTTSGFFCNLYSEIS
jgi:hypothetical protein